METQKLILAEDVFDELNYDKLCTIRKGRRDIQLNELVFESLTEKRIANVMVHMVMFVELQNIPEEFVTLDGYRSYDDMLRKMKRFYPDMEMNTECTVIVFSK